MGDLWSNPALASRIEPEPMSGCWLWTGAVDRDGYAKLGGMSGMHRTVYTLERGPVPEGMTLDHLCNVRCCVRPSHLEPVTHGENHRRAVVRRARREPRCPNCGEPWSLDGRGVRICRPCVAARRARAREEGFE